MQVASSRAPGGRISLIRPEFFTPKYWLTWSGIGILRILELLPYAAQRTLSFLPVKIDSVVRESAESSTEWRV
jgi:hypothetical protein